MTQTMEFDVNERNEWQGEDEVENDRRPDPDGKVTVDIDVDCR